MFRWYAVNTYSGHENKVKQNLEHRRISLGQENAIRQIVIPTEQVQEMKDGQKQTKEQRTMPGYLLVNMNLTDDSWSLVKNTPGVTGFVGASNNPVPLNQGEVDRLLHREAAERPRTRAQRRTNALKIAAGATRGWLPGRCVCEGDQLLRPPVQRWAAEILWAAPGQNRRSSRRASRHRGT